MEKYILWSNLDPSMYDEEILEQWPDATDMEIMRWESDFLEIDLEAERANLDKELGRPIVCVADLGLWDGRRSGYKFVGTNLKDCLCPMNDMDEVYVEGNEVCQRSIHHDGTNYLTYRVLKAGISEFEAEEMIYDGAKWDDITEPLGKYVTEIYGWEVA